jgi:single-stranded-DNA-specific exonuclease
MPAIAFGFGHMLEHLAGATVDVVYGLEENVWNGRTSLQLKVKDMKLSQN